MKEGRKELFYLWLYEGRKERNVLFNDALNTFYLRLYEGRKEIFYLTTHSIQFIYGFMEGRKEMLLFNDALNTFCLEA